MTPIALVAIPSYLACRLSRDSPKRLERLARGETMTLFDQLNARTVRLNPVLPRDDKGEDVTEAYHGHDALHDPEGREL